MIHQRRFRAESQEEIGGGVLQVLSTLKVKTLVNDHFKDF